MRGSSPPGGVEPGGDATATVSAAGVDTASAPGARGGPARRWRWIVAAAVIGLVAVCAVATTVRLVAQPRPDATLQIAMSEPDEQIITMIGGSTPWADIRESTLRGFEPYQGVEVWSAVNARDSACLVIIDRSSGRIEGTSCVPVEAELFTDLSGYGLPDGARMRFVSRGDTLDVYTYLPEEAD